MRGHTRGIERPFINAGTELQWSQRFQKNLQCHEAAVLLARNAERHPEALQEVPPVFTTKPRYRGNRI